MYGAIFRFSASHGARSLAAALEQLTRLYRRGYCQLRLRQSSRGGSISCCQSGMMKRKDGDHLGINGAANLDK